MILSMNTENEISRIATAISYVDIEDMVAAAQDQGEIDLIAASSLLAKYRENDGKIYGQDRK
jgi:hypothetical protein